MTVALLVIGLAAAGIGTTAVLRNILVQNLETSLTETVTTDVARDYIEVTTNYDEVTFERKPIVARSDTWVAIYAPDGTLEITAGGDGSKHQPIFPQTIPLTDTYGERTGTRVLDSADRGSTFRAATAPYFIDGGAVVVTQLIARPVAPINNVVATFAGIYTILAVITIVGGALLTRWLVTLTFRSLGQVETTAMAIAAGDFGQRLTDIEPPSTEVGRLKSALNAMLGRLDAALSERDSTVQQMRRFIGDASHELRTPLVTVRGYAELYRMGALPGEDEVAQAMDRIESEAKRMGLLVEDLLALARLDEKRDVVFTAVDLRPVARDAALDVRATSPQRTVTVIDTTLDAQEPDASVQLEPALEPSTPPRRRLPRVRNGSTRSLLRRRTRSGSEQSGHERHPPTAEIPVVSGEILPIVLGDENRIRQVIANLLGNARRFTADDSPITLRIGVDAAAGAGWIEVVDHGEGVPDQIKEKIFQRFWRADTSRARETGGTGLGLSIVASIVDALHGRVRITDTPGGGATFHVGFPLATQRDLPEHAHPVSRSVSQPGRDADA